ncbi:glycosyltransferase family 1 protein [Methanolobus sp. ZRKC2]|uniref:glycosyltransferase family 4 protein n=1 Tax=Methanolobus sp. ZRKC2 TaxID=3125783 RepID=UPI00324BA1E9
MKKPIKVAINGRDLSKIGGGTKTYLINLLNQFSNMKDENYEFYIVHNNQAYKNYFSGLIDCFIDEKNPILFDFYHVPLHCRNYDIDVLFAPKNVIPYFVPCKKVVTIHDLAYFMPELNAYTWKDTFYMKKMIKSSSNRADLIISVSENTKKDIVSILRTKEEKVKAINSGVSSEFKIIKNNQVLDDIRQKYQLNNEFILFTGGITPRKNMLRLIQAFNIISEKVPHDLVLTDVGGWNNKEELRVIEQNDRIRRLGFIKDEDMPALYNLAGIFAYPSLYEGFGLPLLEAMACGCPVVSSNCSSLPEVVGDAAVMVDPYDIDTLAKAIYEVLVNDNLREELITKGLDRVKEFSWDKCARETLNVLKM